MDPLEVPKTHTIPQKGTVIIFVTGEKNLYLSLNCLKVKIKFYNFRASQA